MKNIYKANKLDLNDIEKFKIDILRDSLKDTQESVKLLDSKIQYLNFFIIFAIGATWTAGIYFAKSFHLDAIVQYTYMLGLALFIPITWNIFALIPILNPDQVICSNDREKYIGIFFRTGLTDKNVTTLQNDLDHFDSIVNDSIKMKELLIYEIKKVSYIRDNKSRKVKLSVILSIVTSFIIAGSFLFFGIFFSNSTNIEDFNAKSVELNCNISNQKLF